MRKQSDKPPIHVSQNFLTSAATIRRALRKTDLSKDDQLIEIGPGKGHITRELLRRCGSVTAIEIDPKLHDKLKEKFAGYENLILKRHDFLKWRLPEKGSYKIFANIPFNLTSDILLKLAKAKNPPEEAWLIMEKGAAMRFMGRPEVTKQSTLLCNVFSCRIVYLFNREDFHPMPSVNVVLLHLKRRKSAKY